MQLFQTVLRLKAHLTKDELLQLVLDCSRHNPYPENRLTLKSWPGPDQNVYEENGLKMEVIRLDQIMGIRICKTESCGRRWFSDCLADFQNHTLTISLERTYSDAALDYSAGFSSPWLIAWLIQKRILEDDGLFEVGKTVRTFGKGDGKRLEQILDSRFDLSLILIEDDGSDKRNQLAISLADRLKGAAHICLCDPCLKRIIDFHCHHSLFFSQTGLMIRWPGRIRNDVLIDLRQNSDDLAERIVILVNGFFLSQEDGRVLSWNGLLQALEQKTIESQADESRENIEVLEELLEQSVEEAQKAQTRMAQLEYELMVKSLQAPRTQAGLIKPGKESDFYPDEILGCICDSLRQCLSRTRPGTRKAHILADLIEANPVDPSFKNEAVTLLSKSLGGYHALNEQHKRLFGRLGFTIQEGKCHAKILWHDDPRYQFSLARTPSDSRAGDNIAHSIKNTCFN